MNPVQIEWKNLRYAIETEDKDVEQPMLPCFPRFVKERLILNNMSGYVAPGSMLAIMGPSGSGKTTLLNVLAGRINRKKWSGEVTINNKPADRNILKVLAGYVPQDDILYGSQTVYEAIMFYAHLKLPHLSMEEKDKRVRNLIDALGLTKVIDSFIGFVGAEAASSGLQRGISGGERKRTSIGCQLITDPALLFLDEPTTGLDSFAAEAVIRVLARQLQLGRTIIFTIHQPSTDVLKLFDQLLIIAQGRTIYMGPQNRALKYFKSVGLPCPADENPGDHFVEVIFRQKSAKPKNKNSESEGHSSDESQSLIKSKKKSKSRKKKNRLSKIDPPPPAYVPASPEIEGASKSAALADERVIQLAEQFNQSKFSKFTPPPVTESNELPPLRRAGLGVQIRELFKRNVNQILRDPAGIKAGLAQQIVIAIIFGVLYFDLGNDQASLQNRAGALFFGAVFLMFGGMLAPLALFAVERKQFIFQYMEALYTPLTYYLCKIIPELFPIVVNVTAFSIIFYFMLGLVMTAQHFFIFWILSILLVITAQAFAFFFSSLVSDYGVLTTIFPIIFLPQMIFSGFYLNSANTPKYFIWIEYLSIVKYTFRPLCRNELEGQAFYCTEESLRTIYKGVCPYTLGDQWLTFRLLNDFPIFGDALVLIGFSIFYHVFGFLLTRKRAIDSTK